MANYCLRCGIPLPKNVSLCLECLQIAWTPPEVYEETYDYLTEESEDFDPEIYGNKDISEDLGVEDNPDESN